MINKLRRFLSLYHPKMPYVIVYMLQQVEYDPTKFGKWTDRFPDYTKVMHRQQLVRTTKAKMLLIVSYTAWLVGLFIALITLVSGATLSIAFAISFFVLVPLFPIGAVVAAVIFGYLVNLGVNKKLIEESKIIFAESKSVKIAVLGSYGKTTMKELLNTVISEGKKVKSTPGNMNVQVSQAKFARKLVGDEDILIIEFGEGKPGDVAKMSETVEPDYAVITGLAANHLDYYPSLESVADDLFSVYKFADSKNVYVTAESTMLSQFMPKNVQLYSVENALGWAISGVNVSMNGIKFTMKKNRKTLHISSELLGRHQVAPLAFVAALADKLGLTKQQIEAGCAKTKPFEHRMQPRNMNGAWLIDDTYNGNLEGLKAGLSLLGELKSKRKWYVTPGLVDQGSETDRVHQELGKAIADVQPDIVVLMENSVRSTIERSMLDNGFKGELRIEEKPLEFYTNIEHIVAAGDIVLMQNDWTDNYN